MKKTISLCWVALAALSGCQTWKAAPRKPDVRVCGDTAASVPHLTWTPVTDMPRRGTGVLPEVYQAYVVPLAEAEAFFKGIQRKEALDVSVPLPSGCLLFHAMASETASAVLQEKYPDLVSAKGTATGADLRLDWNGKTFEGQVLTRGQTYRIQPHSNGGKTWYLVYDVRSAGKPKRSFEENRPEPGGNR